MIDKDRLDKLDRAIKIAQKVIDTTLLITKLLQSDNLNMHEKTEAVESVVFKACEEINEINKKPNPFESTFKKGGFVGKGDIDSTIIPINGTEHIIGKASLFDIDKIREEIERLTSDR